MANSLSLSPSPSSFSHRKHVVFSEVSVSQKRNLIFIRGMGPTTRVFTKECRKTVTAWKKYVTDTYPLLSSSLSTARPRTDAFNFFGPTVSRRGNVDTFGGAIKWSTANQNLSRQETIVFVPAVGSNRCNVSFCCNNNHFLTW